MSGNVSSGRSRTWRPTRSEENVRPLKDQATAFRRRVGDWRILFDAYPERKVVEVVHIVRRTSTTY